MRLGIYQVEASYSSNAHRIARERRTSMFFNHAIRVKMDPKDCWLIYMQLLYFDQGNTIDTAARENKVALSSNIHIAHDPTARGDRPALKFLGLWIETHDCIGLHSRLAVPDNAL